MKAVGQTLQVTGAMNLISTSKLRKGRKILKDTEPFFDRIQKMMCDILAGAGEVQSQFLDTARKLRVKSDKPKRSAILVITSDKGLAGGYNAAVFREVNKMCEEMPQSLLILAGTVGYRYFMHSPHVILENFSLQSRFPHMENAEEIAGFIISQYTFGVFDEVHIVYTHMYSAIKLLPTVIQILPLNEEKLQEEISGFGEKKREKLNFEYMPSEEAVFDSLVPMYIKGVIYSCLVEAYTSEQSARMTAMDEACKNAREMLDSIRLRYNRIRQAEITQEMTEIVSGSAALE
jgi:F-type H+-transporting ATPase subunit gamma